MKRCQKWISDNTDRVIATIVSETGKAYEDALLAEVSYAEGAFAFWAKNAEKYLAEERVKTASPFARGRKLIVRYAPLGVVGVIGPWNYPLTNSFGDCIPALMAGNAVLLKPSEVTPLTSMLMGEMLRECGLPEDVYQVVPGYGETAQALIDEVDFVMFTGSTATGRKVMERAARTLTPVALELGGKDPMIVCADADVERAANAGDPPAPGRHRRAAREGRRLAGCAGARGRRAERRERALLRADGARGRGSLDGVHARGDVRADRPDHEGARRR
jgi:acyl-CoA reductase-like NAD-dependent aldehyde dehydrogenase